MYLRLDQLKGIKFNRIGNNVLISAKASLYNTENISIGDNTRIDDFCILSAGDGGIEIESNVHVGCYSSLIGKGRISVGHFTEISGRVSIYSSTNDFNADLYYEYPDKIPDGYSVQWLSQYMLKASTQKERKNIFSSDVKICNHVVIGAGSVLLPGSYMEHYSRLGAMSLLKNYVWQRELWAGVPARKINRHEL